MESNHSGMSKLIALNSALSHLLRRQRKGCAPVCPSRAGGVGSLLLLISSYILLLISAKSCSLPRLALRVCSASPSSALRRRPRARKDGSGDHDGAAFERRRRRAAPRAARSRRRPKLAAAVDVVNSTALLRAPGVGGVGVERPERWSNDAMLGFMQVSLVLCGAVGLLVGSARSPRTYSCARSPSCATTTGCSPRRTGCSSSTSALAATVDADNFDPTLNSSHASYFYNPDNTEAYGENRWKTGGGIDTGVW